MKCLKSLNRVSSIPTVIPQNIVIVVKFWSLFTNLFSLWMFLYYSQGIILESMPYLLADLVSMTQLLAGPANTPPSLQLPLQGFSFGFPDSWSRDMCSALWWRVLAHIRHIKSRQQELTSVAAGPYGLQLMFVSSNSCSYLPWPRAS